MCARLREFLSLLADTLLTFRLETDETHASFHHVKSTRGGKKRVGREHDLKHDPYWTRISLQGPLTRDGEDDKINKINKQKIKLYKSASSSSSAVPRNGACSCTNE